MELLKDRFFNPTVYAQLTEDLAHAYPQLDKNGFFKALTAELDTLELEHLILGVGGGIRGQGGGSDSD